MAVSPVLAAIFTLESEEQLEILQKIYELIFDQYKKEHPDAVSTQEQEFFCYKGMEAIMGGVMLSILSVKEESENQE